MPCQIPFYDAVRARCLTRLSGEIPGRDVFFGAVTEDLPPIGDPVFDQRTCRLLAAVLARRRALWDAFVARHGADRTAVVLGTSTTGVDEAERHLGVWLATGTRPAAFRREQLELGTPARWLARELGVTGPAYAVSTACSSSAKVFAAARRLLKSGRCDAAIVGGADGRCRFALNGFHALGALAAGACRPLAPDRDGICLGEGAALFAIEPAPADAPAGTLVFAGGGETSDAWHPTAPDPEGAGAEGAMRRALADAGMRPEEIDYVNLHGTGTVQNDAMELKAVRRVFGDDFTANGRRLVESTKDRTGHCLGAAGAVEAAICLDRLASGRAQAALSNSFAFGGSNASVVFARLPQARGA